MPLDQELRRLNRNMIVFDLALGSARELFRRCGPIWLTFAAAHLVAYRRDRAKDWWALSWLRGTELATDVLWSRSPAFSRPGARAGLWFAGLGNLAMTVGFGYLARRGE